MTSTVADLPQVITSVTRRAAADARDRYQALVNEGTIRRLPNGMAPAPDPLRWAAEAPDTNEKRQSWLSDEW